MKYRPHQYCTFFGPSKIWIWWIFTKENCGISNILSTFSKSLDPDQRAPIGAFWSGSELFEKKYGFSSAGYRVERDKQPPFFISVLFVYIGSVVCPNPWGTLVPPFLNFKGTYSNSGGHTKTIFEEFMESKQFSHKIVSSSLHNHAIFSKHSF